MIAVDASAVLAILKREPERDAFLAFLLKQNGAVISPVNWWEVSVRARALRGRLGVQEAADLLTKLNIRILPIDETQAHAAFDAHVRFGRGTPAALNLGDCFAYALASAEGEGLLFKGADFPRTDVQPAL